jgi:hypothetical protein
MRRKGALDRADHQGELDQEAVAGRFDYPSAILRNEGIGRGPMLAQPCTVAASSSPISRLQATISAARIAARRRVEAMAEARPPGRRSSACAERQMGGERPGRRKALSCSLCASVAVCPLRDTATLGTGRIGRRGVRSALLRRIGHCLCCSLETDF